MIVNPGIRRFLGSAIQRLFNSASVSLPLTHTAIPTRGDITPSFTRATTATGQKWDEAGYLDFTALAGEVVFKGARREYNQWTTSSVSLASGANKSLTLTAGTYQFSMGAGTGTATFSGTGGATGTLGASASGRVSVAKTITAGTFVVTASVADLADLQVCNITGETDQTTIRPYVSVGVESAPAYHGSMVDGVKCFPTDRSGNPISTTGSYPLVGYVPWEARTNLCLQSNAYNTAPWSNAFGTVAFTQNATGPDGATSAWTGVDSDGAVASYGAQSMTLTAANWTQRIFVKKTTGAQATYPCFGAYRGSTDIAMCTIDTSNGIATVWTAYTGLTVATSSARCNSYNALFWEVELTLLGTAAVWTQCLMKVPAGTSNPTQSTGVIDGTLQGSAVFYGGTMELGSFATPYIPTTTVAVARNADLLTYTGADVANIKTLACTFSRGVGVSSVGVAAVLTDGTNAEAINLYLNDATSMRCNGTDNNVTQWAVIASNAYTPGTDAKVSVSFVANDVKTDFNGTAGTQDTSATLPTFTQLQIGFQNTAFTFNGPVNHIYGWTRNLSQSELGAIDR